VANLVHELKTPITSLRLTAESFQGNPSPKDRERFADRLIKESDLINRIIDNLRHLVQLESEALRIETTEFGLADLIEELQPRVGSSHELKTDVPSSLVIATDRDKLSQALGNLLDNAAKFSPSGMDVEVTAEVVEDAVRITVRDHGPGISPEHWKRVFERFYKVDRARPREAGGFGLGLAITKHLVQAIGGSVWTEAAAEGGQTFTIELPGSVLTRR
jgi:signal transduction histidine kinase